MDGLASEVRYVKALHVLRLAVLRWEVPSFAPGLWPPMRSKDGQRSALSERRPCLSSLRRVHSCAQVFVQSPLLSVAWTVLGGRTAVASGRRSFCFDLPR